MNRSWEVGDRRYCIERDRDEGFICDDEADRELLQYRNLGNLAHLEGPRPAPGVGRLGDEDAEVGAYRDDGLAVRIKSGGTVDLGPAHRRRTSSLSVDLLHLPDCAVERRASDCHSTLSDGGCDGVICERSVRDNAEAERLRILRVKSSRVRRLGLDKSFRPVLTFHRTARVQSIHVVSQMFYSEWV